MGLRSFLLLMSGCAIAACGGGAAVNSTFSSEVGGAGGTSGLGAGGQGGSPVASSSQAASSNAASSSSSSSSSASSSSSSSSSSGGGCDYTAPDTCPTALQLSDINGDSDSDVRTATGSTSKWFKVLVHDPVNLGSDPESYTATLQSPPGMDFDLFAYDGDGSGPDCFATATQAAGNPESVTESWSDGLGNDDRWISLEVRYISGQACGAAAKWTLTVAGHTAP